MGERIKALRKVRGLNQQQAAKRAGISQPSWSDLESGSTKPAQVRAATLLGVARALHTTPAFILENRGTAMDMTAETEDEIKLLGIYRDLRDENDRGKVLGYAEALIVNQPVASPSAPFNRRPRKKP